MGTDFEVHESGTGERLNLIDSLMEETKNLRARLQGAEEELAYLRARDKDHQMRYNEMVLAMNVLRRRS